MLPGPEKVWMWVWPLSWLLRRVKLSKGRVAGLRGLGGSSSGRPGGGRRRGPGAREGECLAGHVVEPFLEFLLGADHIFEHLAFDFTLAADPELAVLTVEGGEGVGLAWYRGLRRGPRLPCAVSLTQPVLSLALGSLSLDVVDGGGGIGGEIGFVLRRGSGAGLGSSCARGSGAGLGSFCARGSGAGLGSFCARGSGAGLGSFCAEGDAGAVGGFGEEALPVGDDEAADEEGCGHGHEDDGGDEGDRHSGSAVRRGHP